MRKETTRVVPSRMRAVEIAQPGGPEVLRLCERQVPVPAAGEVLIEVQAAGVNRPDVMQRRGLYPPPPGASDLPGLEVAGRIVCVGQEVGQEWLGKKVCALITGGGYAQYCTAALELCLPIPSGLDFAAAASLPEACFTVWANVFERGALHAKERFLVHGGSSGVGVMAIQLARAFGAEVFATAGSREKCRLCEELGATAILYREEDFVARVKELTAGRGVDLILDIVGGDYLQRNLEALSTEGRLVQIAFQAGPKTSINLVPILLKRLTLTGSTLRSRSVAEKAHIAKALRERVWPLLESGEVRPVVDSTFPLARAADAHRLMEESRHRGKIVLTVSE
jgi:putative PIG3 family NAD(P)H quinone oxidoreductase